jgi:hypothetical protein
MVHLLSDHHITKYGIAYLSAPVPTRLMVW